MSKKTGVDVCVLIKDKGHFDTFFTKNGLFESKMKKNLEKLLDINDEIAKIGDNDVVFKEQEIQCELSINNLLQKSVPRNFII